MINRGTKLTAFLLAAASVTSMAASMTPAMALEKLGNREGTIKEAIAFENGKYVYEGYRTEDDDTGIWYNKGTNKDSFIEDLEEYEIKSKFGTKYAYVTEDGNSDDYLVDLSTGKIVDDESAEEKKNTAESKLISGLKKAERYNGISDDANKIDSKYVDTLKLFNEQFGEVWYQYVATTESSVLNKFDSEKTATTTGTAVNFGESAFTGFVNESGKYIDTSYRANLYVYNARKGKATLIEKYGKVYRDEALKLNLKEMKALAQDKDNIYALTTVEVVYYGTDTNGNYVFDDNASTTKKTEQKFIQKISKSQGDKEDGAYTPKNIESYQLDNRMFEDADDSSYDAYNTVFENGAKFAVKDGYLYVTYESKSDEITTAKLKLGKAKLDVQKDEIKGNKYKDIDTRIVMQVEDDDTDAYDFSIDVDGNTWAIYKGKIKMFDGKEFKDMYACDRSFDQIDVYDKNSLVAWDKDSDAYTTVQEGKNQTVDDATKIDPDLGKNENTGKVGWDQQTDGNWILYDAAGKKVTGWANVGGRWYYMNADGVMQTGWLNDNGTWYYLNPVSDGTRGAMKTGWLDDNGTWYYFQGNGAMQTGWLNDNGSWYYFNPVSDGTRGAMKTGWMYINGSWYYFNPISDGTRGIMKTGWVNINGTWYYLKSSGAMACNEYINGYWLNSSGAWV